MVQLSRGFFLAFLGAFVKLRKTTVSPVMSVRIARLTLDGFS
jgi:hypothetical protein